MSSPTVITADGQRALSPAALPELMRSVLRRGALFRFRATGASMSPLIRGGDTLTVAPIVRTRLRLGEVVAFVHPETNRLVVHRIVAAARGAFLLWGDRVAAPDGWMPRAAILGRVTQVERNGRRVRLGLGAERAVVALMQRRGWLSKLLK